MPSLPRRSALLLSVFAALAGCVGDTVTLPSLRDAEAASADAGSGAAGDASAGPRADAATSNDAGTPSDAGATADAAPANVDAGPVVSADCARGTWCWERPVPSGEAAVAAQAFDGDRAVALAASGTLARYDGAAWTLQLLDLDGQYPVHLWGDDPRELLVLTTDAFSREGHTLFRVDARGATRLVSSSDENVWSLVGAGPDAVYAIAERRLVRWTGEAWSSLGGPGGDVWLSSLALDGDGLLVLESWGSGSGGGVLHRWQDGAWSRVVEFARLGVRVDGPIVRGEGAWWLRGFDVDRGVARLVRGDAEGWRVLPAPTSDGELVAVGDRAWWVSGERAWRLVGVRWQRVLGFPGRQYGTLVGHGERAWVFDQLYASREESGTWRAWGEGPRAAVGFVDIDPARVTMFVGAPTALVSSAPETPRAWAEAGVGREARPIASAARSGVGAALVLEDALVFVDAGGVRGEHALPRGVRAWGVAAIVGRDHAWVTTSEGQLLEWRGAWSAPIDPPTFAEAPGARPTIAALHATADGTVYVGVWTITGDKQVYEGVFARDGGGWRLVVEGRGVFGAQAAIAISGDRDDALWVALDGLWRVDARGPRRLEGLEGIVSLAPAPAGGVLAVDRRQIATLDAAGRVLDVLAMPLTDQLVFEHVRRVGDVTYAATSAGQLVRYAR